MTKRLAAVSLAAFLLTGCVYSQKAHDVQLKLAESIKYDLRTIARETEQKGDNQVAHDRDLKVPEIEGAYDADLAEAVEDGSVEGVKTVIAKHNAKLADLQSRLDHKQGGYYKLAGKSRFVIQKLEGIMAIEAAKDNATAEVYEDYLKNELPGDIATGIANISAAHKAKVDADNATKTPTPDSTDTSGDPLDLNAEDSNK